MDRADICIDTLSREIDRYMHRHMVKETDIWTDQTRHVDSNMILLYDRTQGDRQTLVQTHIVSETVTCKHTHTTSEKRKGR